MTFVKYDLNMGWTTKDYNSPFWEGSKILNKLNTYTCLIGQNPS